MIKTLNINKILRPRLKEFKSSVLMLRKNKLTYFALIAILLLVLIAVFAPLIAPYPSHAYESNNPEYKLMAPSTEHFFGTDELGRDIFSRVLYGSRISLITALLAVGLALFIGIPLGAIAGATGGFIDELIMRITDMFLSFPPLLLAIAISAFLGPSLTNATLALAISWWPWYTRLVRGQAVSLKERQFVKAARAVGTSHIKIIFSHIVPNCIAPVIVQASMDLGSVILTVDVYKRQDKDLAAKISVDIQRILVEEAPAIFAFDKQYAKATHSSFKGYKENPAYANVVFFYDTYREK